jgi:predicted small lipoprotein YifL
VVALSLAGCGRKGALDLPPNASGAPQASAAPTDTEAEARKQPSVFNSNSDAAPQAPRGAKKSFILDPLLDERPEPAK